MSWRQKENRCWSSVFGAIVILYTVVGGMHAVAWTDLIQGTIMIVGFAVLAPGQTVRAAGESPDATITSSAEEPKGKGLWYMDTSSAAAEAVTLWMASGAVIHLFPTGQGNVIGNPVTPVIKLSANPITVATMSEHIDLDVTGILKSSLSLNSYLKCIVMEIITLCL